MKASLEKALEPYYRLSAQLEMFAREFEKPAAASDVPDTGSIVAAIAALPKIDRVLHRFVDERAAILDALPAAVALLDEKGVISLVNKPWRDFTNAGCSLTGNAVLIQSSGSIATCAVPSDPDASQRIDAGINAVVSGKIEYFNYEYRCHLKGTERWCAVCAVPLPNGHGSVVMQMDVSERKAAERNLAELNERLEALIREAPIGIFVHCDFKPLIANDELARMFGYPTKEAILSLTDCRILFAEEERERLNNLYACRLRGDVSPEVRSIDVKGRCADGTIIELENRGFSLTWGNQKVVCVMLNDVTKLRALERHRLHSERLAAVGQLTGGVAHDFNNLLTVILANVEMIADRVSGDETLLDLLQFIKIAATNGADLTNRLLSFGRRQTLQPVPTDVNRQLVAVENWLGRIIGEHIEIEIVAKEEQATALVDRLQFENALINICVNARDAMPSGGTLHISTKVIERPPTEMVAEGYLSSSSYIVVEVADTGTGIAPENLGRVFEPFFTTKNVGSGTGLGLSMVYGFAKQSGGHVEVESDGIKGTTIRLYLPKSELRDADTSALGEQKQDELPFGHESILLVEDDVLVRSNMITQLWGLGYFVSSARDGNEAKRLFDQGTNYDLLLTDVVMPGGMSGQQLADSLRMKSPNLGVLFTSGYSRDAVLSRDGKALPFLPKPFTRRDLAFKVRLALRGG